MQNIKESQQREIIPKWENQRQTGLNHITLSFHSLRSNLAEQRPTDLSKDMKAIVSDKKNYVGMELAFRTTGSFIRNATSRRASSVFSHTIFPSREANTTPPELLKQIPTLHISYIIKVPFLKLITTV